MAHPCRRVALVLELNWGYKQLHEVFVGVQQYARQHAGWQCTIDPFPGETFAARSGGPGYHGVIARATPQLASQAAKAGVPVVNVWFSSPDHTLPRVVPDLPAAARMAAEHLIARGLKQFGYLGYLRYPSSETEFAAFCSATERTGAACTSHFTLDNSELEPRSWSRMTGGLSAWVKTWKLPIGIFGAQDLGCRYLIDVCLRHGLRIPEDVAIVGLGNEPVICDEPEPTLSSVDLGSARIGYRAAELLDRLMRGKAPPSEPILIEPAELVVRRSTDVFAVDDPMVARAMQFMARNGHEQIRVADVVASLPVARRSLERRFRAALGRSIGDEISRLRIERAKRLIVGTTSSISSIAAATGYCSYDHFNKSFRRLEGMSPGEFRRQHAS